MTASDPLLAFATLLGSLHSPVLRDLSQLGAAEIKGERRPDALVPSVTAISKIKHDIQTDCGSSADAWVECIKKSSSKNPCAERFITLFNCAIQKTGARVEYAEDIGPNGKTSTENWKSSRQLAKQHLINNA